MAEFTSAMATVEELRYAGEVFAWRKSFKEACRRSRSPLSQISRAVAPRPPIIPVPGRLFPGFPG